MKHYKDLNTNEVYAFEADGSQDKWINFNLVPITDQEADMLRSQHAAEHFNNLTYAEKRAAEYPSLSDQLDALWKGGAALEEMRQRILDVKSKYPKV